METKMAKINPERAAEAATRIAQSIEHDHNCGLGDAWNASTGQWLVYGFERQLGFAGAVELEAQVERAWKRGLRGPELARVVYTTLLSV
jgi:hypothetical protein